MEAARKEEKERASVGGKKGKVKSGSRIASFLAMGGFLVVIPAIIAIAIIISLLTNPSPDKGIKILSPKANDVVKAGDSYEVLWKAFGAESFLGPMVTIEFSRDGGKSWQKVEGNVPNKGKYMWSVPKVDSTKCKVRIFSQSKPKYRGTSKIFSVKQGRV